MKSILNITNKNETVNLSCRIEKDVYAILYKDALEKGISLNSLVNSIAKKFTNWEIHAANIFLVPMLKETLAYIFETLDEKQIQEIATKFGSVVIKDLVYLSYHEMNFDNVIKAILLNGTRFGTVKYEKIDSTHNINIHHGICLNFSKFLSFTHLALANDLSLQLKVSNIDKNMICMQIKETLLEDKEHFLSYEHLSPRI